MDRLTRLRPGDAEVERWPANEFWDVNMGIYFSVVLD